GDPTARGRQDQQGSCCRADFKREDRGNSSNQSDAQTRPSFRGGLDALCSKKRNRSNLLRSSAPPGRRAVSPRANSLETSGPFFAIAPRRGAPFTASTGCQAFLAAATLAEDCTRF